MLVLVRVEFFYKSIYIYFNLIEIGLFLIELNKFTSGKFSVDTIKFLLVLKGVVHKSIYLSLFYISKPITSYLSTNSLLCEFTNLRIGLL